MDVFSTTMSKRKITKDVALDYMAEIERPRSVKEIQAFLNAVEAAERYPLDRMVQEKFCFAMAYGSAKAANLVLKAGGLQALVHAMQQFPQEQRMHAEACEALRNLVELPDAADEVLTAGGLEAVLNSMRMNPEADWVQQEGCGLICRLVTECDAGRDAVMKSPTSLELILKTMEAYPRCGWIAMWGCQAMERFAQVDAKRVDNMQGFKAVEEISGNKTFAKSVAAGH
ncbi:unnamed protein product [Polarella glacialis]|uniref:Uncharacterized protein n=1 Tax=Polarella glacialis TaxID=89957 RepID=A0A813EBX4_POLGL|nr:unnamed protein product [Polarella glacialis]